MLHIGLSSKVKLGRVQYVETFDGCWSGTGIDDRHITRSDTDKLPSYGAARPRNLIGAQIGVNMRYTAFHLGNVGLW
jgi:hypothetical protein